MNGTREQRVWCLGEPKVRVLPSILSADMARLGEQVACVAAAGAEAVHVDVMDGHFVPNISIGVPVVESLRQATDLFLDTHLMITDPVQYAEPFVKAGADSITFHVEVVDEPRSLIERIRGLGANVGITLNPGTPVERILDYVPLVDIVLVMSVEPGFGGQPFLDGVLDKVARLAAIMTPAQRLEIDGGINPATIGRAAAAGADMLVAGSAIFRAADPAGAYRELLRLARQAASKTRNDTQ